MIKCRANRFAPVVSVMRGIIALSAVLALAGCVQTTHLNPSSSDILWPVSTALTMAIFPEAGMMSPNYPALPSYETPAPLAAPLYGNTPLYGEIPAAAHNAPAQYSPPRASSGNTAAPKKESRTSCGRRKQCGQLRSCEEAYRLLRHCGFRNLDRDGDGVPCESLCGG